MALLHYKSTGLPWWGTVEKPGPHRRKPVPQSGCFVKQVTGQLAISIRPGFNLCGLFVVVAE
jgi:hypothetical protein